MNSPNRILIVDDEELVRSDLKYLIRKSEWRHCAIREEEDGEAALLCLDDFQPDIVITDIRMPNMDGIELMKEISRRGRQVCLIVVSGYSDFDYATKALRFGATDYLLKPIDEAYFFELVKRVDVELRRTRARNQPPDEDDLLTRNRCLRGMIRRIMRGAPIDAEEEGALLAHLLDRYSYAIGALRISLREDAEGYAAARLVSKSALALEERAHAQADSQLITVAYEPAENMLIVVQCGGHDEQAGLKEQCAAHLLEIAAAANPELHAVHMVMPEMVPFEQLEDGVRFALDRLMDRFRGHARCTEAADDDLEKEALARVEEQCLETLEQLLRVQPYGALLKDAGRTLGHLFYSDEMARAGAGYMQKVYERLEAFIRTSCSIQAEASADFRPVRLLGVFYDMRQAVTYLLDMIAQRKTEEYTARDMQSLMWMVRDYIDGHYAQPLTLTDVAERFGVNPNYLSTMFREAIGVGFVEHITNCRLENAKRLLRETDVSAASITELSGFSSPSYFQRVFKAKVGMTPKRYRQLSRNEE